MTNIDKEMEGYKLREEAYKEARLKLETHKCDYGCDNTAVFYFKTADKWCCSAKFFKCPGYKKKAVDISLANNYNSKTNIKRRQMKADMKSGKLKCHYCNGPASYLVSTGKPCCTKYAKQCPEHSKWVGDNKKKWYDDHPGSREKARAKLKECQNRPIVKAKKKIKMIILHNKKNDCEECVEFQEKYKEGITKRKENTHIRQIEYLKSKGYNSYDIPEDPKELAIFINRVRSKYRYKELLSGNININSKIEGDV